MSEAELHILAGRHARSEAGRGRARRAALPAAGRVTSTTTRAPSSSILTKRCRPRWPTCSPRFEAGGSAYAGGRQRSRDGGSRSAPMAGLGRSCAGCRLTPRPGAQRPGQPGLRRRLRVRPLPLPSAAVTPDGNDPHQDRRTAPDRVGGRHPRPPPRLHHLGRLPGQRRPPGRQHAPTPVPGRPGRATPCARASSSAGRCGRPMSTPLPRQRARRTMSARLPRRPDGHADLPLDRAPTVDEPVAELPARCPQPRRGRPGPGRR